MMDLEVALGNRDPREVLLVPGQLQDFALQAGLSPKDPQDLQRARRYLEGRLEDTAERGRGNALLPLPSRDPLDQKPKAPKREGLTPRKQQEVANQVFLKVRNRPDITARYLELNDLLRAASLAATQNDANVAIEKAHQLSGKIYSEIEKAAQGSLPLDKQHQHARKVLLARHNRVLESYGYFDAHRIQRPPTPKEQHAEMEADEAPADRPWRNPGGATRRLGRGATRASVWFSDQASLVGSHFGRKQGPIGAFAAVTRLYNRQARRLSLIGLIVGVLFVPLGFFTFSGWSIVALAMVITSAVYFVLLNIVKVLASIIVAGINATFGLLIGLVVSGVEQALRLLHKTPTACDVGQSTVVTTFCSGHQLAAEGLIPASELRAINISLLDPERLKPTMSTKPLIQAFGEWTGLYRIDLSSVFAKAFGVRFQDWLEHGNLYAVIALFFLPLTAVAVLAYWKLVRPALQDSGVIGNA